MTAMGIGITSGNVPVGGQYYDGEWRDIRTGEKMTFYGPAEVQTVLGGGNYLSFGSWHSPNVRKWTINPARSTGSIICQKQLPEGQLLVRLF